MRGDAKLKNNQTDTVSIISHLTAIVPECPKAELSERIHTLKQRIAFVRGQIDILADSYENSKQYIIFQRYRLMKAMIKQILTNCIDLRHNYNC